MILENLREIIEFGVIEELTKHQLELKTAVEMVEAYVKDDFEQSIMDFQGEKVKKTLAEEDDLKLTPIERPVNVEFDVEELTKHQLALKAVVEMVEAYLKEEDFQQIIMDLQQEKARKTLAEEDDAKLLKSTPIEKSVEVVLCV